jgi:hypothetical protein
VSSANWPSWAGRCGVGAAGAAAFFGAGVFISEILFGRATETELQPNIDGLSFDEVLLGYAIGIPILLGLRHLIRTRITRQS